MSSVGCKALKSGLVDCAVILNTEPSCGHSVYCKTGFVLIINLEKTM